MRQSFLMRRKKSEEEIKIENQKYIENEINELEELVGQLEVKRDADWFKKKAKLDKEFIDLLTKVRPSWIQRQLGKLINIGLVLVTAGFGIIILVPFYWVSGKTVGGIVLNYRTYVFDKETKTVFPKYSPDTDEMKGFSTLSFFNAALKVATLGILWLINKAKYAVTGYKGVEGTFGLISLHNKKVEELIKFQEENKEFYPLKEAVDVLNDNKKLKAFKKAQKKNK